MNPRTFTPVAFLTLAAFVAPLRAADAAKVTKLDDRVRVELGGSLFTEYIFKGAPRPYFYPVLASDGTELMRHYPMKKDAPGEVRDHPHHRSLWFTHGDVNGLDFWAESNSAKQGRIVTESVDASMQGGAAVIRSRSKWVNKDDAVQLTDETTVRMRANAEGRFLDYEVTLKAPADNPVILGDTKEGSMAIRVPLWMTPPHSYSDETKKRVKHEGKGTIINAEGITNDATWGKRSTWVDYHAPKDGKVYGIAMFDHPKNPRHPTWWHVRSYALFAANPFGKHDFENLKSEPTAGNLTIPAGGSVTFRWRMFFHLGDEKAAKIAERFADYAAGK
ncbi:MAG: PmoA family protein [Verrucomicrobia bacterium]|nr:PmoA family protein [Verrucomicrobiota bacterium]